jgi:ABC-2 type transport system permease protein
VRLASLSVATFVLVAAPLLLMYVGGVLADLPIGRETQRFAEAAVGAALLAACLACTAALVAALTIRRGLAVTAVIVLLVVSYTVVATIQGISHDTGHSRVGEVAGMFSPYTLVNGVQVFLFDSPEATPTPPTGAVMGWLYLAATATTVLGAVGGMLLRYRKVQA